MISGKVHTPKSDIIASFKPFRIVLLEFFQRKYWNQHALVIKGSPFDNIDYCESSDPCFCIFASKEEPAIIAISIEIVLNH